MVRGGSSPLGRTGKAPLAGAFCVLSQPPGVRPVVWGPLSRDKYPHMYPPSDNTCGYANARRALGRRHPRVLRRVGRGVEAGELAAKTVNNALGTLVVCLSSAVDDGLLAVNPALRVQRLPPAHIERDYPPARGDPSLSRCMLGRLPPARRVADRQRPADLGGAGATSR